jgi:hypothetical protein
MVITHLSSPESFTDRLNFGLQSFLLRSSRHMANSLKQIRLSTSQGFRNLLSRFYRAKDDFYRSNRISKFQRTKYPSSQSRKGSKDKLHCVQMPYILPLNR